MLIQRSTKCSLKFATAAKREQLREILKEYGRVVNIFIDAFWGECPNKGELLKPIVDLPADSWLSARLRKVAAREAIAMVTAMERRGGSKPVHRGERMCLGETLAELQTIREASGFDRWLVLTSIGRKIRLDLPIKLHKHFHKLQTRGKLLKSFIVTVDTVQLCFEIETGLKQDPRVTSGGLGLDTGIKALASTSTGNQYGSDVEACIARIKRCKHGSKGQKTARRALRQRMDEVAKQVLQTEKPSLLVVENLSGITRNTRRRLGKDMRRSIGSWNVRYWLTRLERQCEDDRVVFRTVSPSYTSQTCSCCGHVDRGNRIGTMFKCLKCGHQANADVQASLNILSRYLSGPYGAGCKAIQPTPVTGVN